MRNLLVSLSPVVAVSYFVVYPDHLFAAVGWMMTFVR
jgi:hypothetical protein